MKKKRTLYECAHARVKGERILCSRGYPFSVKSEDGGIESSRLAKGEPLALNICQHCGDFDRIGPKVAEAERGWLKKKEMATNGLVNRDCLPQTTTANRDGAWDEFVRQRHGRP